jgi:tetratricopeptide (TPR) repeat protein
MKAAVVFSLLLFLTPAGGQSIESAIELYEHGKFPRAAEILSGLIQQNPTDKALRVWQGKTFMKLRRWDDAIAQFQKAVEFAPKDGMAHLWLGRAYGRKAEHALIGLGPARRTRAEFETALQLSPESVEVRFDLLAFYLEAPGLIGGGRDKAEAQAQAVANLSPRLGHVARAEIFEKDKDLARAQEALARAAAEFARDAGASVDLAKFLMRTGKTADAEAYAQNAVSLAAGNREARMILAAIQLELRRNIPGACNVLQELASGPLTDEDPLFEEVYYWLGRAYLAMGRKADARKAWETSLAYDPDYTRSKDALKQNR